MTRFKKAFTLAEVAEPRQYGSKQAAFTLAEVLITLGIIGVVAAMTMPTLTKNINDRAVISKLKKIQSILSQATMSIDYDIPISSWGTRVNDIEATQQIYEQYKQHLQVIKDCGCGTYALNCWAKEPTKALNGQVYQYGHAYGIGYTYCAAQLKDGTNISFDTWTPDMLGVESADHVFFVYVDVNGNSKPNTLGRDVFQFVVRKESPIMIPAGLDNGSARCSKDDDTRYAGLDCAAKVLSENKISY